MIEKPSPLTLHLAQPVERMRYFPLTWFHSRVDEVTASPSCHCVEIPATNLALGTRANEAWINRSYNCYAIAEYSKTCNTLIDVLMYKDCFSVGTASVLCNPLQCPFHDHTMLCRLWPHQSNAG